VQRVNIKTNVRRKLKIQSGNDNELECQPTLSMDPTTALRPTAATRETVTCSLWLYRKRFSHGHFTNIQCQQYDYETKH